MIDWRSRPARAWLVLTLAAAACAAATLLPGCCNPPSPDVSARFTRERAAVEAATLLVTGKSVDLAEPVYTYHAPGGSCPDDAVGCCNTGWCAGIFIPDRDMPLAGGAVLTPAGIAIHEYTHRALLDLGLQPADGPEHPPLFWRVWNGALSEVSAQQ